jgi:hypothetical protein
MAEYLSSAEIRSIILAAHKIKEFNKCAHCDGSGWENWNGETGGDVRSGRLSEYNPVRVDGECEVCGGVGYVDILMYEQP